MPQAGIGPDLIVEVGLLQLVDAPQPVLGHLGVEAAPLKHHVVGEHGAPDPSRERDRLALEVDVKQGRARGLEDLAHRVEVPGRLEATRERRAHAPFERGVLEGQQVERPLAEGHAALGLAGHACGDAAEDVALEGLGHPAGDGRRAELGEGPAGDHVMVGLGLRHLAEELGAKLGWRGVDDPHDPLEPPADLLDVAELLELAEAPGRGLDSLSRPQHQAVFGDPELEVEA